MKAMMMNLRDKLRNLICRPAGLFLRSAGQWLLRVSGETESELVHENESQLPPQDTSELIAEVDSTTGVALLTVGKVMSVLERQLVETSTDIEESVVGVCQGFRGMAQRAQSAVSSAEDAVGGGDADGRDNFVDEMRRLVNALIQNINDSCDFSQRTSDRLAQIESQLESVDATLSDIEEIACKARVVALNGQVEAARLGDAGAAFRVVAEETKDLSRHAGDTSNAVRELVSSLADDIKETSTELKARSESDAARLRESQEQALRVLEEINDTHQQMVQSLNNTSGISQELSRDIAGAVVSMQFQDRVSQRIAHVIETLQLLVGRVDSQAEESWEPAAAEQSGEILDELASRYTMDSERHAMAGVGESEPAAEEFEVELF